MSDREQAVAALSEALTPLGLDLFIDALMDVLDDEVEWEDDE